MIETILVILLILWFLGYITIPGIAIPRFPVFFFNGRAITLWDILIFLVVVWAIEALPTPFREIAGVLLILWLLSTFGILAIAGLSHLLVIAIIVGIIASLFV